MPLYKSPRDAVFAQQSVSMNQLLPFLPIATNIALGISERVVLLWHVHVG